MEGKTKIQLSSMEMELVLNADWILTKNSILQKVKYMLEQLQSEQFHLIQTYGKGLPSEVISIPPKISKGENYKGLPYMVLDYPRYFKKEDHFAIRSMFWWGNFFSITLHLSGAYKLMYEKKLQSIFPLLREQSFFICTARDQWEHHFEKTNYLPMGETNAVLFKKYTGSNSFIKLAKMYPLEKWDEAESSLLEAYSSVIKWLGV